MKAGFFLVAGFSFVLSLSSCSNKPTEEETKKSTDSTLADKPKNEDYMFDCVALKKDALRMDSIIMKQTEVNVKLANATIKSFTGFAYHCSTDSMAPVFLIKTAQIAQAISNVPQAKIVLEKCINDYLNFKNRPAAIFLLAQLYDEVVYLNNEEQAKILYQKIIDEYPKSDWAASAKGAIKFIGKSDQQIMDELNKKKK